MDLQPEINCDEGKILQTIARAKEEFWESQAQSPLSRWEFLTQQCRYIQKRWWVLQGALLVLALLVLQGADSSYYVQRSLGVAAPLFVLLAVPELWKNRSSNAMEVEGTTFYSLRQIYAARLTLFAGVDLLLLSLFFLGAERTGQVTVWEMLVQFLLPCNVSCCICFSCLYSRKNVSEVFSLLLCGIWTAAWENFLLHNAVYMAISAPLWCGMLILSFGFLVYSIVRGQRNWSQTWEGKPVWN